MSNSKYNKERRETFKKKWGASEETIRRFALKMDIDLKLSEMSEDLMSMIVKEYIKERKFSIHYGIVTMNFDKWMAYNNKGKRVEKSEEELIGLVDEYKLDSAYRNTSKDLIYNILVKTMYRESLTEEEQEFVQLIKNVEEA